MLDDYIAAVAAAPGVLAAWHFQDASGDFADEIGSNDLADTGTVLYQQAGPVSSAKSVHLAANAMGQTTAVDPDPETDQDYTIGLWVRPDALTGSILRTGRPFLTADVASDKFRVVQQGVNNNSSSASMVIDTWQFWVWSRQGGSNRTYLNGVLDTDFGVGSPGYATARTDIGHDGGATCAGYYFGAFVSNEGFDAADALTLYDALLLEAAGGGIPGSQSSTIGHGRYYG